MPAEEDPAMDGRDSGSPQQFCLRWNNYQNNLTSCFDQLLQSQSFVDVTLACEGQSLKAHKVVLSACSPYFQSLLMENPCRHPIIIIRDIKYCDLKAAVDFMYRGEINVSQDQIPALLKVADTLKIRGLTDVSEERASLSGQSRMSKRAASPDSPAGRKRRRPSEDRASAGSRPNVSPEPSPAADLMPPEPARAASTPHQHEDIDIRPGIAEMIREEERARMLENTQAWMGASTSTALAETYQYRMQSLWQQCWSTNQNMVHNLRLRERGPLKSWRPETMAEAIFSVLKEGLSLSQAARKYDIPYPTFVLYANRVHNMLGPSADGGAGERERAAVAGRRERVRRWQRSRGARVAERRGGGRRGGGGARAASADVQHGGGGAAAARPPAARGPAAAADALAAAALAAHRRPRVPALLPAAAGSRARTDAPRGTVPPVRLPATRRPLRLGHGPAEDAGLPQRTGRLARRSGQLDRGGRGAHGHNMKRASGRGAGAPSARCSAAAARCVLLPPEPQRLGWLLLNSFYSFRTPLSVSS